jgi:hypothetical protein
VVPRVIVNFLARPVVDGLDVVCLVPGVPQPALFLPIIFREAEPLGNLLGGGVRLGHGVRTVGVAVVRGLQDAGASDPKPERGEDAGWGQY